MKHSIIISKLKRALKPSGLKDRPLTNPTREWFLGLLFLVVSIVASGFWSANMYLKYQDYSPEDNLSNADMVVYREGLVDKALQIFSEKEIRFQALTQDKKTAPEVPAVEIEAETEIASSSDMVEVSDEEGSGPITDDVDTAGEIEVSTTSIDINEESEDASRVIDEQEDSAVFAD